ncbi:hypothetical protein GCM10023221_03580 [Luteimicrobium xylanilyticum]|uniref:DUF1453 domain-containing protein n=1 Tax=Luteimicrobium xylanilyticum TaxID=1133546 RepID=A0A5P9Q7E0_9MICO|nr:hypothetical protein [Luteimicrobium xylanilyticum]QFU97348.1 hypothetical protein KDY119_00846 [Luteimicrobium xylanilyticum]
MISTADTSLAVNIVLGLLVLVWILSRQVQKRPVKPSSLRAPVILAAVGLYETASFLRSSAPAAGVPASVLALLALGVVVGGALAAWRGSQVRVWRDTDGTVVRQGTGLTVLLWLVAIGAHLGLDVLIDHADHGLSGLGSASLLLYLGVVLGIQSLVVQRRAQILPA